jgi:acyl-CoA thioesterase FadM
MGNKSYEVEYVITVENGDEIVVCASGMSVQVCYNYLNNSTVSIPDSWRQKVQQFEIALA